MLRVCPKQLPDALGRHIRFWRRLKALARAPCRISDRIQVCSKLLQGPSDRSTWKLTVVAPKVRAADRDLVEWLQVVPIAKGRCSISHPRTVLDSRQTSSHSVRSRSDTSSLRALACGSILLDRPSFHKRDRLPTVLSGLTSAFETCISYVRTTCGSGWGSRMCCPPRRTRFCCTTYFLPAGLSQFPPATAGGSDVCPRPHTFVSLAGMLVEKLRQLFIRSARLVFVARSKRFGRTML